MRTYLNMVYRLKGEGMSMQRAIEAVAFGYTLTKPEVERLKALTEVSN